MTESLAFVFRAGVLFCRWLTTSKPRMAVLPQRLAAAAMLCAVGLLAGCTDIAISKARHQITAGNYATAHEYFATTATNLDKLSPRQRRLVMDGLCRTEYQIGASTYPLTRQLQSCAAALNQPGSESRQVFNDVAHREREELTKTIKAALAQGDLARADDAIRRYRALPGNNPQLAADWARQLWSIVDREAAPGRAALTPTISQLSRQFRHQQNMSKQEFRGWIEKSMTVDGNLMVSKVEIGRRTLDLWLSDDQRANAALNLDRFARVNDGLVARCQCNGRTKVAIKDSGLPAYLVRLDTESHQSEVLILDQP